MSIVVYRCDTCKRDVELVRNIKGLETIQRCVITHGCRGKLYQTDVLEDFLVASLPDEVDGLDNWIPRRILYNHEQTIENTVWIVNHNLGTYPAITVLADRPLSDDNTNREEITPDDIQLIDKNNLLLRFDRPRSGIAQLVARSSDPLLFEPVNEAAVTTEIPLQLTNQAKMVIATRVKSEWSNVNMGIQLIFTPATGNNITVGYTTDSNPSALTSWSGVSKVVIRGKVYQVREFDTLAVEMTTGTIANGVHFRFSGFDFDAQLDANNRFTYEWVVDSADATGSPYTPVSVGDVYILLSNSPFGVVDKITNQVIDITNITRTQNSFTMYYDTGELYASPSIIQTIYPPIRTL